MKLLFDGSVPRPLALALSFAEPFTMRTVQDIRWTGTVNGLLLPLAAAEGFDALVTVDRGIEHQQNDSALPIPAIMMLAPGNRFAELQPFVPYVASLLSDPPENRTYYVPE